MVALSPVVRSTVATPTLLAAIAVKGANTNFLTDDITATAGTAILDVFLPLGFLTGLFGVNVGGMPGVGSPLAFALLCSGLIFTVLVFLVFFRWKMWI